MALGIGLKFEGQVKPDAITVDGYESDLSAGRIVEIPSNQKARYIYDSSNNLIYAGFAPTGLAENTDGWLLWKFTYDSNNNCTAKNVAFGNWTGYLGATYG